MATAKPASDQSKKPTLGNRDIHLRPLYLDYSLAKQEAGEKPDSYDEWVKKNTPAK